MKLILGHAVKFLLAATLSLSGCATTQVEKLPGQPRMERVTTKMCAPAGYPFYFTAGTWSNDLGKMDDGTDAGPGIVVFAKTLTSLVFTIPIDSVLMPIELLGLAVPDCKTSSATRPTPDLSDAGSDLGELERHAGDAAE